MDMMYPIQGDLPFQLIYFNNNFIGFHSNILPEK